MTKWTPRALNPQGPVYIAIADALALDIRDGRLASGDRLPTHRDLARRLGVNVVTVTRAYAEAARRGLVEGEVGRGTFVRQRERRLVSIYPVNAEDSSLIDFSMNTPATDPELLDLGGLFASFAADPSRVPLHMGYLPAGLKAHREAGAEWMQRAGLQADPAHVFVCTGGQHALTVALSTISDPGDVLLAEELTYPGIKALASLLNLRTTPLAMDAGGLLPGAFEEACQKNSPKALYCMPTLQNPTGTVLSEKRRIEIAEIARRYGVMIVEDDTTGSLIADAPAPIATHAPEQVIFVSSLSKSVCSGLRIGYLLAPTPDRQASVERLSANLAAVNWMTPPLMGEIASHLIRSGKADEIVQRKRAEGEARWELFEARFGPSGLDVAPPEALPWDAIRRGSFVWMPLPEPWRADPFTNEARRAGVALTPAEAFVVGRAHAPHAARICIGTPATRDEVVHGLDILGDILAREPDVCRSFV